MKEKNRKGAIIVISIILIFLAITLIWINRPVINMPKNNQNSVLSVPNSVIIGEEIREYMNHYRGFTLISNKNNFERIESILDRLDITHSDYPYLNKIYYLTNNGNCNGGFDEYKNSIYLYPCNKTLSIRDYEISPEDSEAFILAHELCHYIFKEAYSWGVEQGLADDYAHDLSKSGTKLRGKR